MSARKQSVWFIAPRRRHDVGREQQACLRTLLRLLYIAGTCENSQYKISGRWVQFVVLVGPRGVHVFNDRAATCEHMNRRCTFLTTQRRLRRNTATKSMVQNGSGHIFTSKTLVLSFYIFTCTKIALPAHPLLVEPKHFAIRLFHHGYGSHPHALLLRRGKEGNIAQRRKRIRK